MRLITTGCAARRLSTIAACAVILAVALTGFTGARAEQRILFAAGTEIPRPVQDFAWQVVETRCNYQSHERWQRSFWAHHASTRRSGGSTVYSIEIVSDVMWKKMEPPATIAMTVVDDGRLHLTDLTSWFITCVS